MRNQSLSYLRYIFGGIFIYCLPLHVLPQSNSSVFGSNTLFIYNQDKQLPQNSIQSMCFDKWGFLWVNTTDGLARFDGRTFKVYPQQSRNALINGFIKLNEDTILAFADKNEKVLIITRGNVSNPIPYNNKSHGYPLYFAFDFIPFQIVACDVSKSNLDSQYILRYVGYNGYKYARDTFAVIIPDSLKILTPDCVHRSVFVKGIARQNFVLLNKTFVHLNDKENCITLYNLKGRLKNVPLPYASQSPWRLYPGESNLQFYLENNGNLYEVIENKDTGDLMYTLLLNNFKPAQVSMIINKNNETLIVGTFNDGLYVYKKNTIVTLRDTVSSANNNFYTQLLMPDNKTILTGSTRLFTEAGVVKAIPVAKQVNDRVAYRDKNNYFWYVEDFSRLIKTTFPGKQGLVFFEDLDLAYEFIITQLFEDSKRNVWIFSSSCGYFKQGSDQFTEAVSANDSSWKSYRGRIFTIEERNDGIFLLGGEDGIISFNPNKPGEGFKRYALDGVEVRYIEIDKSTGHIWVATKSKGMCSIRDNGKTVIYFPQDNYGNMRTVHYFLTDHNGMTWISTNNGLFITTHQSLSDFDRTGEGHPFYYKFSKSSGLLTNEFDGGCQTPMLLLPDSSLTVSSINGLAWTKTNQFRNPFSTSPIFLETTINGINTAYENGSTLQLNQTNNNNVNLSLAFADWNEDFNIETAYRFSKSSDTANVKWQGLPVNNTINFPFLSTGEYFLTIRKRTGFGPKDYSYVSITITVSPQWFETKWFYAILLLLLILLVQLLVSIRNRQLKKANQLLNVKVAKATEQLEDANTELAQLNDTKDRLITLFNHDLSVPLFYINQMLQQMVNDKVMKEIPASSAENIAEMSNTISDSNVLMEDLLYWVKMQQYNTKLELVNTPVDTENIINQTLQLFKFRIDTNNIHVNTVIEKDLTIVTDERLFSSILYNVISNAIKFTQTGFFNIRLTTDTTDNNRFVLIFENSTVPMDTCVNNDAVLPENEKTQSRGIGLLLVEDFTTMLGFTLSNVLHDGDIFVVTIKGLKNNLKT